MSVILGKSGRSTQVTDFATNQELATTHEILSSIQASADIFALDVQI